MGQNRTYISLFSSAGVGCYGFKMNGYECIATNELLKDRLDIQRANHKCSNDAGYIGGDITLPETQKQLLGVIDTWKAEHNMQDVDVVFATPPCQGMSTANYKKNEKEQVRNSLVVSAIKLIKDIKPKVFVFENVRAFMSTVCTDLSGEDMLIKDSIYNNLGGDYLIYHKVINFMDYGVPSSRPRTIVIGTHKSLHNITPLNLFPSRRKQITLREAIGDFPRLAYGEKDAKDIYHFARPYPQYQEAWIETLKEGESAFQNTDPERRPFKVGADGEKVELKGSYMGNKYRRLIWDKPCACIATRNDQLASQDTIHPTDNRVLSIRELMRVMTIPDSFTWSTEESSVSAPNTEEYLKKNELNIRRCIGEAVPTEIIRQISQKIKTLLDFEDFVQRYNSKEIENIQDFTKDTNFYISTFCKEQLINNAKDTGSFYTPQCVVFDALKTLSISEKKVWFLEPSVGLGAFIPQLASICSECDTIDIDAVEIDAETIESLKESLKTLDFGCNVTIHYHCSDFLKFTTNRHYNAIITNPPYAKASEKYGEILAGKHKSKNLFALFLLKFLSIDSDNTICVIPKNFAIADEFQSIRAEYERFGIRRICDFGVKYFKKVFVEIVSIHFSKDKFPYTEVVDYINDRVYQQPEGYIFHTKLWILYRDSWFDEYIKTLDLDCFSFFRDRQITNKVLSDQGKIRVLRSKNILDDGSIVSIDGYDKYIDSVEQYKVGDFLNKKDVIIMPNFTYNTRATILPKNTIPNGSIAILFPKNLLSGLNLSLYSTEEFRHYYAIVKSYSKFTLNIDNCSIYYIGAKYE